MTTTKVKRLVVVHPDGLMKVFDEGMHELDRGADLLKGLLDSGWTLVRQSVTQQGASTMILVEKEERCDTVASGPAGTVKSPPKNS